MVARALPLSEWHTFNAVLGSAAGALTGLMFVVTALMAGRRLPEGAERLRRSFATPTIVHFSVVLALAGILSMPRIGRNALGAILSVGAGLLSVYAIWVIVNARRFRGTYAPDLEDLAWHFVLPMVTYLTMLGAGIFYWSSHDDAIYAVAGGMVILLIIGIHNAWDSAVFQVFRGIGSRDSDPESR